MRQYQKTFALLAFALTAVFSLTAQAQSADNGRFLSLAPPSGLPIIPVMEGWIANPDGTVSFSFGFINRNDVPVDIPVGTANYIEPAKYSGMQPTHFPAGRSTGLFTVTVPADEANDDIWWYIKTGSEEALKVPGRYGIGAYELDFILPRPQGAMQPLAGFGEDGQRSAGLFAQVGEYQGTVRVGEPVVFTANVEDISVRDTTDPRFLEPISIGVQFRKYQGPGMVEFTHHESTAIPENPYEEDDRRFRFFREITPGQVKVEGGSGLAHVIATFSEPGEYIIHTKVDNFGGPDSSNGDQCCWTNIVQKVTVSP
ncbi:MAG: hypothetical protein COB20_08220 [SAR86 cluster bacterium]|uniref:DUF4198 domain-containing protein n=1 Tax=SAR86 cluster bacterium TaxID=2030880 RepID=A0A2A4X5K5_9GAMM|nr:MAG: hypothetical protein COB20_08220 [SAR86 cluster bacterium]